MDVYAVVSIFGGINGPQQEHTTPLDTDGGGNPMWNFRVEFKMDGVEDDDDISIRYNSSKPRGTSRNTCHEAWKLHLSISESWQTAAHLLPREEKQLISEERVATRKQKAEAEACERRSDHWAKRAKTEAEERAMDVEKAKAEAEERAEDVEKEKAEAEGRAEGVEKENTKNRKGEENENGKSTEEIVAAFEKRCKAMSEHLSLRQMREILEATGGGVDDAVVPGCQDVRFCGTLDDCPACGGTLKMS
ncbi:Poly [ADP-ribose] polymerase 3, variant 2 [Salvia divinorum]|uniref:Poly [ADP-ribose] polymerase 3, variant 2 n=1 Tax=Salvia divinorum TaxID=28513 RepID=A0ABD1HND3_SALDI